MKNEKCFMVYRSTKSETIVGHFYLKILSYELSRNSKINLRYT